MNQQESPRSEGTPEEPAQQPDKVPLTARLLLRETFTARRAGAIIAGVAVIITVAGGILIRVLDHQEYKTIGKGLWFALQTVTTVGYGDVTPANTVGRVIAGVIMLTGIGFLTVVTASVTAALVESNRKRFATSEADLADRLEEVGARLSRIEAALDRVAPPDSSGRAG